MNRDEHSVRRLLKAARSGPAETPAAPVTIPPAVPAPENRASILRNFSRNSGSEDIAALVDTFKAEQAAHGRSGARHRANRRERGHRDVELDLRTPLPSSKAIIISVSIDTEIESRVSNESEKPC